MSIRYVHSEQMVNAINDKKNIYKVNYANFRNRKYIPMRRKIRKLDFENDADAFKKCEGIFNAYYQDILNFETTVGLTTNSKLHTSFLEEFSCYFLEKLPDIKGFDVFKNDVFAGLKMNSDLSVSIITKDVDFCIGKEITAKFGNQKVRMRLPIVSVEMKTYTDKTMLGEIVNTARKLKGANPRSKVLLLTWVNSFKADSAIEVACDSSLDEIIVMSEEKRKKDQPTKIVFTSDGLKDYYNVIASAFKEALIEYDMPTIGRLLLYVKLIAGKKEE